MQLKILVIEPNSMIADIMKRNFDKGFGASLDLTSTVSEGIAKLAPGHTYNIVIIRNLIAKEGSNLKSPFASILINSIIDQKIDIPVIVLGDLEIATNEKIYICETMKIEELNKLFLKALNLKKENFSHMKLPKYVPFPISNFYLMNQSPCDVYIKLNKATGDEYIKRLHLGDNFNKQDLLKYENLGVADFYVTREDREHFLNGLLSQTINNLKENSQSEISFSKNADSFVIGSDMIKLLGVTPACVELVEATIENMRSQITKSGKFGELLKRVLDNKFSFSYRRSYLICILSHMLLPRMDWGGQDQRSNLFEKLSFVSYFHDIYLTDADDEKMFKITNQEQLRKADLTPRQKDIVINHANHAALIVHNFPHLPQGVDLIIKQHHGTSNGVGFPEVYTTSISPMAIFFVVVEEFANLVLLNNDLMNIVILIDQLKEKFTLPSYRKIVTEIEAMILKK